MSENPWLSCTDPETILGWLGDRATDRKLRLFACACFRDHGMSNKLVPLAEAYTDGNIPFGRLAAAARDYNYANRRRWFNEEPALANRLAIKPIRGVMRELCGWFGDEAGDHYAQQWVDDQTVLTPYGDTDNDSYDRAMASDERVRVHEEARREALERVAAILRDSFPDPFRHTPAVDAAWLGWKDGTVSRLAEAAYDRLTPWGSLDNGRLAILADALEEAGCEDSGILGRLRATGERYRGFWPLDLLLGRT
jgi:hypothetical protein